MKEIQAAPVSAAQAALAPAIAKATSASTEVGPMRRIELVRAGQERLERRKNVGMVQERGVALVFGDHGFDIRALRDHAREGIG